MVLDAGDTTIHMEIKVPEILQGILVIQIGIVVLVLVMLPPVVPIPDIRKQSKYKYFPFITHSWDTHIMRRIVVVSRCLGYKIAARLLTYCLCRILVCLRLKVKTTEVMSQTNLLLDYCLTLYFFSLFLYTLPAFLDKDQVQI